LLATTSPLYRRILGGIGGYQGGDCKEYLGPDSERGCLEYLLLEYRTYILTTVFTIVDCNETFFFRHSTYTSFPLKKKKKKKKKTNSNCSDSLLGGSYITTSYIYIMPKKVLRGFSSMLVREIVILSFPIFNSL
jgi:hypothetical protein